MLVNLISALQFISSINANCLNINPIDYHMYRSAVRINYRMLSEAQGKLVESASKRFSIF